MKHLEDSDLIDFLRKNKPIVPLEADNFEQELFNLLANEPQFKKRKFPLKFMLSGALTAGLMLILGGNYWLKSEPQIAKNKEEQVEEFLVNSWSHGVKGTYLNQESSPESEWLMLTNY